MPIDKLTQSEIDDARKFRMDAKLPALPEGSTDLMFLVLHADPRFVYGALANNPAIRDTINAQNADGMTALMYAVANAKGDVVKTLKDFGADSSLKNKEGKTAVQMLSEVPVKLFDDDESIRESVRKMLGGRRRKTRKTKKSRKAKKTRKA